MSSRRPSAEHADRKRLDGGGEKPKLTICNFGQVLQTMGALLDGNPGASEVTGRGHDFALGNPPGDERLGRGCHCGNIVCASATRDRSDDRKQQSCAKSRCKNGPPAPGGDRHRRSGHGGACDDRVSARECPCHLDGAVELFSVPADGSDAGFRISGPLVAGGDEEEEAEADDGKAAKPTGAAERASVVVCG